MLAASQVSQLSPAYLIMSNNIMAITQIIKGIPNVAIALLINFIKDSVCTTVPDVVNICISVYANGIARSVEEGVSYYRERVRSRTGLKWRES